MDKVKLDNFKCSNFFTGYPLSYGACGKIPNPGDKIYSCFKCPDGHKYRCQTCLTQNIAHNHGSNGSTLAFEPNLTKLVSEYLTLALDESQKCNFFCSNSKNGCEEEFLALRAHDKSCTELEQEFLTLIINILI